jgi:cytochrome c biogenesis protein CcmG/thiol:disulfide interchange protein DsbE
MRALLVLCVLAATARAGVLTVGQPAVELDIAVDANGKPFKLAAYRGRWVVITVGAAWCVPCNDELPVWNTLASELAGRVTFVTLSLDNDIADGKAFHKRLRIPHLVRAYMPEDSSKVAERYGAAKMPSTFVIGPDGVVRYVQPGFEKTRAQQEYQRLKTALVKLLPKPAPRTDPKAPPPRVITAPVISPVPPFVMPDQNHVSLWADQFLALPF